MAKKIKIVAICGSPHRGNTYDMLKVLQSSNPDIDLNILMLCEFSLKDCYGCYSCINNGEVTCPLKDDRDVILAQMKEADGTIFASPTYARMVSALMKKFVERTSFLAHRPIFFGKYAMTLVTCAGFGADMTSTYLQENFTQCGYHFVSSAELMMATKSEEEMNYNRDKAVQAYEKLIKAIETNKQPAPTFGQLVYFNIFKSISELNKLKGWADYEFYRDKKGYYYDVKIPFWKHKMAKWVADREVKKMMVKR